MHFHQTMTQKKRYSVCVWCFNACATCVEAGASCEWITGYAGASCEWITGYAGAVSRFDWCTTRICVVNYRYMSFMPFGVLVLIQFSLVVILLEGCVCIKGMILTLIAPDCQSACIPAFWVGGWI